MQPISLSPNRIDVNSVIDTFYTHHIDGMVYECKHNPKSNILLLHSLVDDFPLAGIILYCPNEGFATESKIKKIIKKREDGNVADFEGNVGAVNIIVEGKEKMLTSSPNRVSKNTSLSINNLADCDINFIIEWSEGHARLEKTLKPDTAYIIKDIIFPMVFNISITPSIDISQASKIRFARTSWKCTEYFYKWSRVQPSQRRKGSFIIEKPHINAKCITDDGLINTETVSTSPNTYVAHAAPASSAFHIPKLNMAALATLPSDVAGKEGCNSAESTPRTPRSNLDPTEVPPQSPRISIVRTGSDFIKASPTRTLSLLNGSRRSSGVSSSSGLSGVNKSELMTRSPVRKNMQTMSPMRISLPTTENIPVNTPLITHMHDNSSAFTEIMSSSCKIAIKLAPFNDNSHHYVEDHINLIGTEIAEHYQTISAAAASAPSNL